MHDATGDDEEHAFLTLPVTETTGFLLLLELLLTPMPILDACEERGEEDVIAEDEDLAVNGRRDDELTAELIA